MREPVEGGASVDRDRFAEPGEPSPLRPARSDRRRTRPPRRGVRCGRRRPVPMGTIRSSHPRCVGAPGRPTWTGRAARPRRGPRRPPRRDRWFGGGGPERVTPDADVPVEERDGSPPPGAGHPIEDRAAQHAGAATSGLLPGRRPTERSRCRSAGTPRSASAAAIPPRPTPHVEHGRSAPGQGRQVDRVRRAHPCPDVEATVLARARPLDHDRVRHPSPFGSCPSEVSPSPRVPPRADRESATVAPAATTTIATAIRARLRPAGSGNNESLSLLAPNRATIGNVASARTPIVAAAHRAGRRIDGAEPGQAHSDEDGEEEPARRRSEDLRRRPATRPTI